MITIREILVPTDFSDAANAALAYAKVLAAAFGSRLHVVHVLPTPQLSWAGDVTVSGWSLLLDDLEQDARQRLSQLEPVSEPPAPPACLTTMIGTPVVSILDYVRDHAIDLIVMGTHGRGFLGHMFLGSVAERVVRLAPVPVLTIHGLPEPAAQAADREVETARATS